MTAAPELARRITVTHDLLYVCAPTPLQHGVVAGLEMADSYYTDLSQSYAKKRDILCSALADAGAHAVRAARCVLRARRRAPPRPADGEGGGHDVAGTGEDRERAGDLVLHADPVGETLCRFCFAKEDDVLEEAARRLRAL